MCASRTALSTGGQERTGAVLVPCVARHRHHRVGHDLGGRRGRKREQQTRAAALARLGRRALCSLGALTWYSLGMVLGGGLWAVYTWEGRERSGQATSVDGDGRKGEGEREIAVRGDWRLWLAAAAISKAMI